MSAFLLEKRAIEKGIGFLQRAGRFICLSRGLVIIHLFYQIIPKTLKALRKSDKEFSVRYLKSNITQFSEVYSNVSAYDFTGREALDLLKEIEKIDRESYFKIISGIDRDKVLNRWDQFSGISPRKKQWVKKRKKEFLSPPAVIGHQTATCGKTDR